MKIQRVSRNVFKYRKLSVGSCSVPVKSHGFACNMSITTESVALVPAPKLYLKYVPCTLVSFGIVPTLYNPSGLDFLIVFT